MLFVLSSPISAFRDFCRCASNHALISSLLRFHIKAVLDSEAMCLTRPLPVHKHEEEARESGEGAPRKPSVLDALGLGTRHEVDPSVLASGQNPTDVEHPLRLNHGRESDPSDERAPPDDGGPKVS